MPLTNTGSIQREFFPTARSTPMLGPQKAVTQVPSPVPNRCTKGSNQPQQLQGRGE